MSQSSAKTLKDWYSRQISLISVLYLLFCGILLLSFGVISGLVKYRNLKEDVFQAAAQVQGAINNRDREGVELVLSSFIKNKLETDVALCRGGSVVISIRGITDACSDRYSAFNFTVRREIHGENGLFLIVTGSYLSLFVPNSEAVGMTLVFLFFGLCCLVLIFRRIHRVLIRPFLKDVASSNFKSEIYEFNVIRNELSNAQQSAINQNLITLASQVSHDIRSPLAALEMVLPSITSISEDRRLLLRSSINRIRDIANTLVKPEKNGAIVEERTNEPDLASAPTADCMCLYPLVEEIVTEKRIQFRENLELNIEFNLTANAYGLFSKVNGVELKRVLSNLINNAVESCSGQKIFVKIDLFFDNDGQNKIRITDNGKGVPNEILSRLGEKGLTSGKSSGNGFGLYHAFNVIRSWRGVLDINTCTESGRSGTSVTIGLPPMPVPNWYASRIKVSSKHRIVVFDDDTTIHQIWNDRFNGKVHEIVSLSSIAGFRSFFRESFFESEDVLYLMDYEIIGSAETGLDLIEQLGLSGQAILVTSHFEEVELLDRCNKIGLRILPKGIAGFVLIDFC